jgi:hypothetical protein
MPTGTAIVDFGAHPGSSHATVTVTGQTGIDPTTSFVEAWVRPQDATAAHGVDDHFVEPLRVTAGDIVSNTGFTIHAECLTGLTHGTFNINWVWT